MRILIATFGSLGDIYPYLAISEKLNEQGANVSFVTSTVHRALIESAGHAFFPMRPEIIPDPVLLSRFMDEFQGGRYLLRDFLLPAIRNSYADVMAAIPGHDVLVTQVAAFGGPLAARKTGIPWVSSVLAPLSFFSADDPSALAAPLIGIRRRFPALTRMINGLAQRATVTSTAPVTKLAFELGLTAAGNPIFEGQHSPRCVLALFSKHFAAPQTDWPTTAVATGFPFRLPAQASPAVEQFLSSGPAPIVFTLGSSAVLSPGKFYELAQRSGHRALLLAGAEAANIRSTPDLLAVDYAPHSAVFPRALAIVHQGGMGTMSEALRSGRPSLMVPFAHDQPDNAARCERLGVARVLSRRALSIGNLKRALHSLLTGPAYRNAAVELAGKINRENGAVEAARLILQTQNALS